MFYDIGLDAAFQDFGELGKAGCDGFCIAQTLDSQPKLPPTPVPVYSRIDVEYDGRLDSAKMSSLRRQFNLVCIIVDSLASLPTISKLNPDLVHIPVDMLRYIRKTLPGTLQENGTYVEVCVRDGMYENRVAWMNGLRKLLRLGCKKYLVVSSGARGFTELKSKNDVLRILDLYSISGSGALSILRNTERLLRCAALRRYSASHEVAVSTDQGPFKNDFIINYSSKK
ncbi:ribonuclease P/MRP protein subunit RPP1 [Pancytospora philotis]|nr:ribonuclease P/MRP protein subunit RPP1 [Pancytospora philotis]